MYNLKFVMNNLSGHCQFVSQWSGQPSNGWPVDYAWLSVCEPVS